MQHQNVQEQDQSTPQEQVEIKYGSNEERGRRCARGGMLTVWLLIHVDAEVLRPPSAASQRLHSHRRQARATGTSSRK